jgi:Ser/Thr protein kinase RdoA (MazF antagonist)
MLNFQQADKAAKQFSRFDHQCTIEAIGHGLIHQTYKISGGNEADAFILQAINRNVFSKPEDIISNYLKVCDFLSKTDSIVQIPAPRFSNNGQPFWIDEENNFWRATSFVPGSYSPLKAENIQAAEEVADVFAGFTKALAGLDMKLLKEIIPGFHNLEQRWLHFESAINLGPIDRLLKSTHLISEFRNRKALVNFYESAKADKDFPDRVMHHDCKISNILFDKQTHQVICPVDLDTVMPGKFFSDLGDMIRTMACTEDENSILWEKISINEPLYKAILRGYLRRTESILTKQEKDHIHLAGLIMIFMQGIRFLTDYLHGDTYYKIEYPGQNLNRALNQLILLERLEEFLYREYGVTSIA